MSSIHKVTINTSESYLEGIFHQSKLNKAPAVLILHPHPLHGGSMNNKVVYRMFQSCVETNCSVLRFNFRGVGNSPGEFDNGLGELRDAGQALDWLENQVEDASSYWVFGFSFGASIALQLLMRRPEIEGFVITAPSIDGEPNILSPCPTKGLIIQGDEDEVVPEENSYKLWQKLEYPQSDKIEYKLIKGANHMFEGSLDKLQEMVTDYIQHKVHASSTTNTIY